MMTFLNVFPVHAGEKGTGLYWPLDIENHTITGWVGSYQGHTGLDIACAEGNNVYAVTSGTATYYQRYKTINGKKTLVSYGNFVIIENGPYKTKYCHMSAFNGFDLQIPKTSTSRQGWDESTVEITIGSRQVNEGDVIGYVGTTGNSSGPHLHFELYLNGSLVEPSDYVSDNMSAAEHGPNPPAPTGAYLDCASGGAGTVSVEGWARTPLNVDQQMEIHVYLGDETGAHGDKCIGGIIADKYREDAGIGNHGFSNVLNTNITGTYYVWVAFIDYYGKDQADWECSAGPITITAAPPADTAAPSISSVSITDRSASGYKVTVKVTDNIGVTKVAVPTWTKNGGQDDLAGEWNNTQLATKESNDTWVFFVKTSDHNNEYGIYYTDVYAWDGAGNMDAWRGENNKRTEVKLGIFDLTYNPNGGTVIDENGKSTTSAVKCVKNNIIYHSANYSSLSWTKPSRTGYTFKGFYNSASGGTMIYGTNLKCTNEGTFFKGDLYQKWDNLTVYAQWTPNKYTVSLDVNGGTVSAASIQRNFNDKYGSIETPKKEGYTFTGWYKEKELKNKVLSDTVVSTANNHTLYAGWSVNAVTVKFDAKGGNCETKSTNVNFGSAIGKLPAAEWPEEGYVFDGWYKSETGNDKVSDKEVIKGETTLYAHWKKSEFKGKGTKAAPFCIETAEDLFKLSELINSPDISECYKSCYYVQTADIDLENKLFTPIGISDDRNDSGYYTFNGSYNGKYHKITGLNVRYEGKKFAGLFGKINQGGTGSVSELKNLSVTGNVYSETAEYTGGIAGEISYETVVENCDFHGKVTGSGKVGGIAGQFWQGSSISDCYVNAELVSLNKDNPYTGGLAGYITVGDNNDTRAVNFMASNFYYTGNKDKTLNGGIIGKTNIGTAKAAKIEFSSCYYNEEASSGSVNGSEITGCKSLTEKFMKNASELFGEQFVSDSSQNDEYPVFEWQAVPYQFLGEGTEESPYIIANKTDLENMRDLVNKTYFDYYKKCYRLTSDIDLENELWILIGKETKNGVSGALSSFSGKFDGGYHTVSNLKVSEKDKFTGFFGCINNGGVLENLIITGKVQSSGASVAGVCGEVNNGRISNCGFIGDVEGNYAVGGVVGYLWNEGIVENSFQNGTVTGKDRTGGIAGAVFANAGDSIVKNSYHVGKVISEKAEVTGSALGYCSIDEKSSKKIIADNIYTVRGDCQALYNGNCTENNIIELTGAILKKAAIDISDVFMINTNESLNGGYPVFAKQPEEHFLAGDLDNDGIITLKDVVLLRKYYLDNSSVNVSFEAADVYKDGTISVKDIRVLREMYKNL